ncbi:alkene reductase [Hyphomicrobium sp.]|uniref:alkene reductase n=1 Tax=Hyphomicrobium sp. TaxID=82 RepID=UPI0025C1364D|nr:alkene reductase [Hyphomicrobium sp.]MCC7250476.1 alkene reductase [Hyphomicrobium sp.]
MIEKLFTPLTIGTLTLPNRIVMAPLTRNRATPDGDVPNALNAEYYAQRATAGLIITEATQISPEGKGYIQTPGLYSPEQVAGWQKVTDAVHAAGGRIFAQLWHVGRVSHTSLQPNGQAPVAPSAITAATQVFTATGFADTSPPRALETSEVKRVVEDYRKAAENAKAAGFDGIELHAANGYLIDQFLRDSTNKRTDEYGGSIENRTRLLGEVLAVLTSVFPASRVGVRFSPFSNFGDISDSDPMATFAAAITKASDAGLGYLHMVEGQTGGTRELPPNADIGKLRKLFKGVYMANNGYDRDLAIRAVETGAADLIAFGSRYIANPDLVERLARNAPLNVPDKATFYGGGAEGYVDYPFLDAKAA